MHDVAGLAGVSLKTVSRVVNSEPGVSSELVEKVRAAARTLDYRHNLAARNLRLTQRETTSFAVLVQDLGNGYAATLLRAADDVARRRGVVMVTASLDEEADRERDLVANLINRRVDGLILMPASQDQSYLANDVAAGFTVVMIDRFPQGIDCDSVLVDNVGGAELATRHLLGSGHRRVAIVTDDLRIVTAQQRLRGYQQALTSAGLPHDPALARSARTVTDAAREVSSLLSEPEPPTAIFAARNDISQGAVLALRQHRLSDQVALVGFDDLPLAELLVPGLTVVSQNPAEVGRRAVERLLDRLAGAKGDPHHVVLQTQLITRGSGEIRALALETRS